MVGSDAFAKNQGTACSRPRMKRRASSVRCRVNAVNPAAYAAGSPLSPGSSFRFRLLGDFIRADDPDDAALGHADADVGILIHLQGDLILFFLDIGHDADDAARGNDL